MRPIGSVGSVIPGSLGPANGTCPKVAQARISFTTWHGSTPRQLGVEALELDREPLVVDAEQVQHRGVQVVDGDDVLDGGVAEVVGRAVADARP